MHLPCLGIYTGGSNAQHPTHALSESLPEEDRRLPILCILTRKERLANARGVQNGGRVLVAGATLFCLLPEVCTNLQCTSSRPVLVHAVAHVAHAALSLFVSNSHAVLSSFSQQTQPVAALHCLPVRPVCWRVPGPWPPWCSHIFSQAAGLGRGGGPSA